MTPAEYDAWLTRQLERHGPTDAVVVALNSWRFSLSCYDAATLEAASVRMLADAPLAKERFGESAAERHYRLLTQALRDLEAERLRVERNEAAKRQAEDARKRADLDRRKSEGELTPLAQAARRVGAEWFFKDRERRLPPVQ